MISIANIIYQKLPLGFIHSFSYIKCYYFGTRYNYFFVLNIPPCFILENDSVSFCLNADPSGSYLVKASKWEMQLLFPRLSIFPHWHGAHTLSNTTTNLPYAFGSNSRLWFLFHWLRIACFEGRSDKELEKSMKTFSRAQWIIRVKGMGIIQWDYWYLKGGELLKKEKKTPKWQLGSGDGMVCKQSCLPHSFPQGELQVLGFSQVGFYLFFFGMPHGMWDLGSLTRDRTRDPCSGIAEF